VLSYVAVEVLTGRVIADLRDIQFSGSLKATMGRYESAQATLPFDGAPSNWWAATRPYSAAIVCLDDDGVLPLWGGIIDSRQTSFKNGVTVSLITAEGYLRRRYVGDVSFAGTAQNQLVKSLVESYAKTGAKAGLPIRVQIDGADTQTRDRTYTDRADKSLSSILEDLSGVLGGPEWTVEWENVGGLITPVLRTSDRLGSPAPVGLSPAAWFTLPGNLSDAQIVESFKEGDGANDVMATSSGTEDARPQSSHQTYTGDNRPTLEYRWSPSTSITDTATLEGHAQRALASMRRGGVALTLAANRKEAPKLNRDWRLGDDIGFELTAPGWPNTLIGTARAIGWELTETQVTPIVLIDPSVLDNLDTTAPVKPLYPSTNLYPNTGLYPRG
jgi:hypothetical protein